MCVRPLACRPLRSQLQPLLAQVPAVCSAILLRSGATLTRLMRRVPRPQMLQLMRAMLPLSLRLRLRGSVLRRGPDST